LTAVKFESPKGDRFEGTLGAVLAEGGQGLVQEARFHGGSGVFVVKRAHEGGEELLEYERVTCQKFDHPSLVRFLGSANSTDMGTLLAFEALAGNPLLMLNGTTMRPSYRDPKTPYYPLPPGRALELAFDLLLALEHLHERGFVHADVKLSNLLTRIPQRGDGASLLRQVADGNFTGVLIDLGSVRQLSVLKALSSGGADPFLIPSVTPLYAPPEALFERKETGGHKVFSPVMDTYAFGLVFYVLLTGRIPYTHLARESDLKDTDKVLDLKNRETRGDCSPVDVRALSRIPLHDVGFEGQGLSTWPRFHAASKELLRRCLQPDPDLRPETAALRAFFQENFRMRPGAAGSRAWNQGIFQMRPRSNRLLRDVPLGGIRIREVQGNVLVDEAPPPGQEPQNASETQTAEDGSTISFRGTVRRTASGRHRKPQAPTGMIFLADVLREFKAKRPLPVTPPVIVTRTGFSPTELVQCTLYSLGRAREHVKVSGDEEVTKSQRVSLGRSDENEIVVADVSVSKKHCFLEQGTDGGWWLIDNESANGTFLDDMEVGKGGRARLTRGLMTIRLAKASKLTFMQGDELQPFLARALDLWTQAFSQRTSSGRMKKPEDVLLHDRRAEPTEVVSPRESTRKLRRSDVLQGLPAAVNVTPTSSRPRAARREDVELAVKELGEGATFQVHLEGACVEECDTVADLLALITAHGDAIIAINAFVSDDRTPIYRRENA
jgi:serine/threonine protein kinase